MLSIGISSRSEVLLVKGVLKICSKFTGEQPCRSVISIKLLCNFIEITLRHECSPVNLLHIFRKPFTKNPSGWLLLDWFIKNEMIINPDKFQAIIPDRRKSSLTNIPFTIDNQSIKSVPSAELLEIHLDELNFNLHINNI